MAVSGRIEEAAPRQFNSGELQDDYHCGAADRAMPIRGDFQAVLRDSHRVRIARQQLLTECEAFDAETIGQKPEMPDSDEALGQHMQEETA